MTCPFIVTIAGKRDAPVHSVATDLIFCADFYMLNSARNSLVALDGDCFGTIDLANDTFEYEKKSITGIFQEYGCKPDFGSCTVPVVDSHIIFSDKFKSVVGTFNYEKMVIDWTHDVFDTRDYAMIIELTYLDGKLYALDNVGCGANLHVFERAS